jgi:hypothetical protein
MPIDKPPFYLRLILLLSLYFFASIENNPVVKLESLMGLSPSPIEYIFGIKSFFSGMTEGVHQFIRMNLKASAEANIFAPLILPLTAYFLLSWKIPKIDTKKKEYLFFGLFIVLSAAVNIFN